MPGLVWEIDGNRATFIALDGGGYVVDLGQAENRPTLEPGAGPPASWPAPAADSAFEDWRFAHTAPAALISVNIASLVQSPIWTTLFPALSAGGSGWTAEDLNKARSALSDMGQVLISGSTGGGG